MQIRINIWTAVLLFMFFTTKSVFCAEDKTQNSTVETSTTTTAKPKIKIADSDICKKCFCDFDNHQLDCSKRQLKAWFSDEEWSSLQNGDRTFDIIDLRRNNLTKIPKLPEYPVSKLYLSFNQIDTIEIGAFQNLSVLSTLDLSHNQITSKILVPDVFKGRYSASDYLPLATMTELNLGYNQLHNLDPDLFEHLPKLETLILCKNTFQVIDHLTATAISGCNSLKTLDLSYMELHELPETFLHGPRELETLILTGNLLTEIPDDLELAINLKELVLDENLIVEFAGDNIFPVMKNLQYLSISYMQDLKRIGAEGLSNLQKLSTLIASNNPKLSDIDVRAFTKNTTNSQIFDYPPLEKLYLHNNNLTTLDRSLIQRWDKVLVLDLRFNNWICDSTNEWLVDVLLIQINATTPNLAKDVVCGSPAKVLSLPLLDSRVIEFVKTENISTTSVILIFALVAILIGLPLVIGTVVIYRRGCFGVLNRRSTPLGAQYSRAESAEDLHI